MKKFNKANQLYFDYGILIMPINVFDI